MNIFHIVLFAFSILYKSCLLKKVTEWSLQQVFFAEYFRNLTNN